MDTVTYLLGAGASAQCLPVVKELSNRIRKISQLLKHDDAKHKYISHVQIGTELISHSTLIKSICKDLDWMANACDKHSSIDTFAKKLFILRSTEQYSRLKTILSIYFTLEQKLSTTDLRYDNFWASILDEKGKFPQHLRLVSWNYDFQLEQSYLNFSDSKKLIDAYSELNIRSFWDLKRKTNAECFAVYKLNGSATISHDNEEPAYFSDELDNNDSFYNALLKRYGLTQSDSHYKTNLSFAWEHNLNSSYFGELKSSLWQTKTLVIVGYSFPYFNHKIDKYLFECMPFLEKVYFQAPPADAPNIKERFLAINSSIQEKNLLLRTDLDQFSFPNEL